MEKLVLIKLILATPWLIWLSVIDFRKRELPNSLTLGGAAVMAVIALAVNVNYLLGSLLKGSKSPLATALQSLTKK